MDFVQEMTFVSVILVGVVERVKTMVSFLHRTTQSLFFEGKVINWDPGPG